ncbi:MAG: amino acid adenylation domain-containing protein, partial [Halanaerobiales bacterium]|nr:amino acid adenylation domain-containing protein [Halanaerobiales bacterium]
MKDRRLQNKTIAGRFEKEKNYWFDKLAGDLKISGFPVDFLATKTTEQIDLVAINFTLSTEVFQRIKSISRDSIYGVYMILLSGVNYILFKYTNNEDLIVGAAIHKQKANTEYINQLLAFRTKLKAEMSFKELLFEVKKTIKEANDNQNYPLYKIVEDLNIPIAEGRFPLSNVMIFLSNIHDKDSLKGVRCDTLFSFFMTDKSIEGEIEYDPSLFREETIAQIIKHFISFLEIALQNPDLKLSEIDILSEDEKNRLLYEFNDTQRDEPTQKMVYQLFEEQVERVPDEIAIKLENQTLTYTELNQKANQLARVLREKGVNSDQLIGIMVERSLEMAVGIMAILKAGGAYLSLDPAYPVERIRYMLGDSGVGMVLAQHHLMGQILFAGDWIDIEDEKLYNGDISNLESINQPNDLAYLIYTSGTTGKPKGVMIEHKNMFNTINWRRREYQLNEDDRVLQLFSYSFDGFVTSFFTPIVSGAKVIFLKEDQLKDPMVLKNCIVANKITHFISVPSLYRTILECLTPEETKSLKVVTLAGEKLDSKLVRLSKEKNPDLEIVNEYGPTENSVTATIQRDLEQDTLVTIGKPISNTKVYILDKEDTLLPIGVAGQICLAGSGIGRGYLNQQELMEEKFVVNPYTNERMYKTGDVGRWLSDGTIEFLGRVDHQVKVRGFRIELGEIENQLLNHNEIKEAVVIVLVDKNEESYLAAYILSDEDLSVDKVKDFLKKELPEYMIPSYIISLEEMPKAPNGKIDRKALPEPLENLENKKEYIEPTDGIEKKLTTIWSEVFGIEKISMSDNFNDLGGHSLRALSLISKISKEFDVKLPMRMFFKDPTIKAHAEYIKKAKKDIYKSIELVIKNEYYPISSAQKRQYILNQINTDSVTYNTPGFLYIEGNFDQTRFTNTFRELIKRHEALRTSFASNE